MTDTSSSTEPGMEELQRETIRSIEKFSQISKIRVKDNNFIQKKIKQISKQRVEFRKFAEDSIYTSKSKNDDLLEPLKTLLINIKTYKSEATSLKKQVERVGNSLGEILAGIGAIAVATADHFAGEHPQLQRLLLRSVGLDVCTITTSVSNITVGGSIIYSSFLNYELKSVRKDFSQDLKEMQIGLREISSLGTSNCRN
ncbi:hypothetical protein RhiirA5_411329 [Rhizophagus irregularis]|uniref:Uncharacterized protein n=1 Tax=Rhizophagus irregularis TaxID=588596 RepID=A0A2N0Q1B6_9GLOM|nr:hypothetical protein RhiirA5_411329 [Rhizophagus irregularis]